MKRPLPRFYRFYLSLLMLLACGCLLWVALAGGQTPASPAPLYLLKDEGGKPALYLPGSEEPLTRYTVYARLLPEQEFLHLQQGVEIFSEEQLHQTLEHYEALTAGAVASPSRIALIPPSAG